MKNLNTRIMEKFFEIFLFAYSFQNKLFNNIIFRKIGGCTPRFPLRTAYEYISVHCVQYPVAVIATLYYNSLTFWNFHCVNVLFPIVTILWCVCMWCDAAKIDYIIRMARRVEKFELRCTVRCECGYVIY